MGAFNSKIEGVIRPTQSGKTNTYQNMIKQYESVSDLYFGLDGFINIVICSNNKNLVQQTAVRHASDLYETSSTDSEGGDADVKISGRVFSWFSGTEKNSISVGDLSDRIKEDEVAMVVCCGHKKRLTYLKDLIERLNRSKTFKKKVNIWIDEADESINKWSTMYRVVELPIVHAVTLISATFDSIVEHKLFPDGIKQHMYPETYTDKYIKFNDCLVAKDDTVTRGACDYLMSIYDKHVDSLYKPGMRLFAPGDITQESHNQIANSLVERGWAVLILNGSRKEIIKPNGEILKIADYIDWINDMPEEIGKTITSIYHDTGLAQYPFAVTGHICLGRGLTFQNERFLFDWAILPNMKVRAIAYQCAGRVLGNIGKYPNYKKCQIVTTSLMAKMVEQGEKIAINLALGSNDEKRVISQEEIQRIVGHDDDMMKSHHTTDENDYEVKWSKEYRSYEDAKNQEKVRYGHAKKPDDKGFYKSALGRKGPMSRVELDGFKASKITSAMNISDGKFKVGQSTNRIFAAYDDPTDPSTVFFVVKTLTRVRKSTDIA